MASVLTLSAACGAIGYWVSTTGVNLPAFIDTAFTAVPWFCVGYLLRKYTPILTPNKKDRYLPIGIVALAGVTFLCAGGMNFQDNNFLGHNPMVVYIGGISGTLMIMFIAKMLTRLPFISYWGRYSIIILCTHIMMIQVLYKVLMAIHLDSIIGAWPCAALILLIVMFSYQVIIPLCIRLIPWFTAQKDLIKV